MGMGVTVGVNSNWQQNNFIIYGDDDAVVDSKYHGGVGDLRREGRRKPCSTVWNCATELLKSCNGIIVKFVENITLNEYAHSECYDRAQGMELEKLKAEAFAGWKTECRPTRSHSHFLSLFLSHSHLPLELPECNHKFLCGMQNNVITLNMQMPFVSHALAHGKHTHTDTLGSTHTDTKYTYTCKQSTRLAQWRRKDYKIRRQKG